MLMGEHHVSCGLGGARFIAVQSFDFG
jgi:hypothetical protein